jgi:hypothetical protein
MVGRDRHRSPVDRARTLAAIELTYTLAATSSGAVPPPKVERALLDDDARKRLAAVEHLHNPLPDYSS